jgi:pimeloyl-ACP methyl ester carboxylesterase
MTTTALHEQTVNVAGKPMFVAEAGDGPTVVMLHGGGPGASGVSNYSRNIDSLAEHFRVIVPDMPGYGRSAKGVDQSDPFGYLADMIRGLLDELGVGTACLVRPSGPTALRTLWRMDLTRESLFAALNERSAVVFIHPAELPGPTVPGIPPFAADFLLDTTRSAYLLVCNGIRSNYPNIRFILSHAGGFVPYASHRMAVTITADTGRSPADVLDDFASFYFDTALSSSAAALPTLLAFAKPGHITFGSDFPFAPTVAGKIFAAGLEIYPHIDTAAREAIERTNALALFPRLGAAPQPISQSPSQRVRHVVSRSVMRGVARITSSR